MKKFNTILVLLLLTVWGTAVHATPQENFLCDDSPVAIYPDILFTCEALQSYKKGFDTHALELFQRASLWGSKEAQYRVGLFYLGGIGTETNHVEAAAWLLLANERNNRQITERLAEVMAVLSDEQKDTVNQRADELREKYGDFKALERRANWVKRQKRKTTGSRLGNPMASVRYQGNTGVTAEQQLRHLDAYEQHLSDIVTSVEYRDFKVIEPGEESTAQESSEDQ